FNIHEHKMGTPTMGGLLIILATLAAAFLFCDLRNSYVWIVAAVMFCASGLGFADDFLKVARKDHRGVSARTKLFVQALLGCALGAFLFFSRPHTVYGPLLLKAADIQDVEKLARRLQGEEDSVARFLRSRFSMATCRMIDACDGVASPSVSLRASLALEFNRILTGRCIYEERRFRSVNLTGEARERLDWYLSGNAAGTHARLNRYLLESAFPGMIAGNTLKRGDTFLLVPFFKQYYPYLGLLFIPWAALILMCMSNSVNLTDGLDGLAIGTVITVSLPYLLICYLVSRYDYASYLYVPHVPQAGQLAVFLSALVGASMGFLWFNSHPAEVFMGDTGSLSLGAAIGSVALLCKHELLLILVGGIFLIEALSVILQVAGYRLFSKRILLMSPLHNHFVKKGMDEAKIIARFLIVATLLAMAGLSTLKLR
ncbi:MAG: phospho-N-acetylmuramoyl-pentapeptide-transferase, partial [Thermoleophilia bacterium]|nr:phospho-N-acetylmuramoyl-pentapeptide-transferase [Thermoleophilia bacterium]